MRWNLRIFSVCWLALPPCLVPLYVVCVLKEKSFHPVTCVCVKTHIMKKFNKIVSKQFTKKKKFNDEENSTKEDIEKGGGFTYKKLEDDYYWQYRDEVGELQEKKTHLGSMIVNICLNMPDQVEKPNVHALYVVPGIDARKVHQILGVCRKYEKRLVDNVILEYWSEYRAVRFLEDDESILKLRNDHMTSKNHFYFVIQVDLDRFAALKNKERYFIHPETTRRRFKKFNQLKDPEKIQVIDPDFCVPIIPLAGTEPAENEQTKTNDEASPKKTTLETMRSWFISSQKPATLDDLLTPTEGELSSLSSPPLLPGPDSFSEETTPSSPTNPDIAVAGPSCSQGRLTPEHMDSRLDPPNQTKDEESDFEPKKSSEIYYCQDHPPVPGGQLIHPIYCATVYVRKEKKGRQWTVDELARIPGDRKNQIRPHTWEKKYMLLRERTLYFVSDHELLLKYYHMLDIEFLRLLHANFGLSSKEKTIKKIGDVFKFEFYHCPKARAHYTAPFGSVIIVRNLDPSLNPVKMMFCPSPKEESNESLRMNLSDDRQDIDRTTRLKNLWMTAFRLAKVGANHKASYMHYVFEYQKYTRNKYLQEPHDQRMRNYQAYWQQLAEEEYIKWRETKMIEEEAMKASRSTLRDLISFIS